MMPTPIEPETPCTVTMQAQQWQMVLGALNDAPYRIARPLIDIIVAQCMGTQQSGIAKLNGGGETVAEPMPRTRN